jgi:membrane-associated protease RseP (regulator of RpoE activity)
VVTAIDGYLITTREGGRRFADPEVGRPLTLTVRRNGREVDVEIVPEWECVKINFAEPAPPAMPAPPEPFAEPAPPPRAAEPTPPVVVEAPVVVVAAPRPAAVPAPPRPLVALPKGYFGFGISCRECRVERQGDVPVWEFTYNPELTAVEQGGPAHEAGIRSGDVLTHINGHELTSAEGGRLFGAVQPGDTVGLRFARNNTSREAQVVATQRVVTRFDPAPYVAAAVTARAVPRVSVEVAPEPAYVTRFTGVLGDAHIVVTGGPITVSRTDDEMIIQSGDIRVRITRR